MSVGVAEELVIRLLLQLVLGVLALFLVDVQRHEQRDALSVTFCVCFERRFEGREGENGNKQTHVTITETEKPSGRVRYGEVGLYQKGACWAA